MYLNLIMRASMYLNFMKGQNQDFMSGSTARVILGQAPSIATCGG